MVRSITVFFLTATYTLDPRSGLPLIVDNGTSRTTILYGQAAIGEYASSSRLWSYYLGDAQLSVRQLVDAAGTVTQAQTYAPYGVLLNQAGDGGGLFGYKGGQSSTNGLWYFGNGYFDPHTGQFISTGGDAASPLAAAASPIGFFLGPILFIGWRWRKGKKRIHPATMLILGIILTVTLSSCDKGITATSTPIPTLSPDPTAIPAPTLPPPVETTPEAPDPTNEPEPIEPTATDCPLEEPTSTQPPTPTPNPTQPPTPAQEQELPSLLHISEVSELQIRPGAFMSNAGYALRVYQQVEKDLGRPPTYYELLGSVLFHEIGILEGKPGLISGGRTYYDLALEGIGRQFFWNCPTGTCSESQVISFLSDYGFWINAYTGGIPDVSKTSIRNSERLDDYKDEVDTIFNTPSWRLDHAGKPWTHGNDPFRHPKAEYTHGGSAVEYLEETGEWFWIFDQGNNLYCNGAGSAECFGE